MVKLSGVTKKFIFSIPDAYRDWIREHKIATGKFDSEAAYMRYLVRQDIQREGPLPEITPKPPRKKRTSSRPKTVAAPAGPSQTDQTVSSGTDSVAQFPG